MKLREIKITSQIQDFIEDINVALYNISDSTEVLEGVDWYELLESVPNSARTQGDIERAIDNIRDSLRDLERGVR